MEYYVIATCTKKTEAERVAIFMCMIGREGQDIKDTFTFQKDRDGKDIITTNVLFTKFEEYCKPRKTTIIDRHRFLTRDQLPNESLDQYVTELRTLASSCEWGDLKDDLICSRIVSGIQSKLLSERLLREADLKLNQGIDICRADEISKQQSKLFGEQTTVQAIQTQRKQKSKEQKPNYNRRPETHQASNSNAQRSKPGKTCLNCGSSHQKGHCPAYGQRCIKCKKLNHFGKICLSSRNTKNVMNSLQSEECESYEDDTRSCLYLETVKVEAIDKTHTEYATLLINDSKVKFKLDTGAEANVIPYQVFQGLNHDQLQQPKSRLTAYNGHEIPTKGVTTMECKHQTRTQSLLLIFRNARRG